MRDVELIARQAKRIEELQDEVSDLKDRIYKAISHMICIGGPLNDNVLHFTQEQRAVFHRIMGELE
jgi:hypothetical protein